MANLLDLPNEIILLIFSLLRPRQLILIARVCKRIAPLARFRLFSAPPIFQSPEAFDEFSSIIDQDYKAVFKKIEAGEANETPTPLANLLQELSVWFITSHGGVSAKGSVHLMRFRHCSFLTFVEIAGFADFRLKHLVGQGSLKTLRIISTNFRVTSRATEPPGLAQALANLSTLELVNVRFPTSQYYRTLVSTCPRLTTFIFSGNQKVTPEDLCDTIANMKHLHTLEFRTITPQQHEQLPKILSASSLPNLRHLALTTPLGSNPQDLKDVTPHLQSLEVRLMPIYRQDFPSLITDSIIGYLEKHLGLESKLKIKLWTEGYHFAVESERLGQLLHGQTIEMLQ